MRSDSIARPFVPIGRPALPVQRLVDVPFWCAVGFVLVALFFSFRSYVTREVAWAYPASYDQTKYLGITYSAFELLLRNGPWAALEKLLLGPYENGMLIHFEAVGLFLFFGASRLTALMVNYLHLAAYVGLFAGVARYLTASRRLGLLALGLASGTGPFWFGNLVDYRLDFSASCMFGIFVSAVIGSGVFRSRWGSLAAGVAAGLMMMTRFLGSTYIAGIYILLAAYFFGKVATDRATAEDRTRLRHLVGSGLVTVAVALPAIWLNRMAIYGYYVVEQGKQMAIRRIEFPAEGIVAALLYYPKSLLIGHIGQPLALAALAVLALAVGVWFLRGNQHRPPGPGSLPVREAFVFLVTCAFVILAALNLNTTKSPIVIGVLVPVFSWFVVITFFALVRRPLAAGDRVAQWACTGAALLAVALGVGGQVAHFSRHMAFMYLRADASQIVELYEAMGQASERAGWTTPMFASDSMRDYFVAGAPTAVYYERHGVLVNFVGVLGATGIPYPLPQDVMLAQLAQTNFLVLTHRRDAVEPPYPVIDALEAMRPQMEAFARDHLTHMGQYEIYGRQVDLYSRPSDRTP